MRGRVVSVKYGDDNFDSIDVSGTEILVEEKSVVRRGKCSNAEI